MIKAALLADGIDFGEGPRWRDGRLWFSDFYARAVKSVSLAGDIRTEFAIDDQPSGLGWMPDGSLLVVSMTKRQLLRRLPDGTMRVHADLSGVAEFHCNDMVVDLQGRAYVGNFGFDIEAEMRARGAAALMTEHATATIALVQADGSVSAAASGMSFPNGSVITPDGKTLIVGETLGARLTTFDIAPDGALSNRRIWAPTPACSPDGICLDAEGAIWVANAIAPQCIRLAKGGEVLEVIDTGEPCYACMLGGDDGRTLFMLTAPGVGSGLVAGAGRGRIMIATVAAPHAGLP
ncbi:MAG: SMP-30/gluconolactonase/LRE family protein [Proteobacteria bacterium]|nr:SMP-30/gluconolactonase/LRE family protein [Pseudomonadota bacterium]